ncbi:MAG: hypothetical protein GYA87_06495 [Christensenellaceae bacterium]|nr:hypothetical protein [Christensenellaceae bacterium]
MLENEKIVEVFDFNDSSIGDVDNIYVGKVDKIIAKNDIAFIDIGQSKNAFLPLTEMQSFQELNKNTIKQGDNVLVQIKKTAYGDKGAYLTRDIKIPGNYAMIMPFNKHIGISNRIENDSIKNELKRWGNNISKNKYGIVFRKNAESLNFEIIEKEINEQILVLENILKYHKNLKAPVCVYKNKNDIYSLVLDLLKLPGKLSVYSNNLDVVSYLNEQFNDLYIEFYDNEIVFKENKNRKINLENGGNIVMDKCEALTVFDINTSNALNNDENTITNMFATEEIVNNIRLYNISGIIIIDYINMSETDSNLIKDLLINLLKNDRNKSVVHGYTNLGLMEITRKRNITN